MSFYTKHFKNKQFKKMRHPVSITVVLLTNQRTIVKDTITSLRKQLYDSFDIRICQFDVKQKKMDGYQLSLSDLGDIGSEFSVKVREAVFTASGEYILFLNNGNQLSELALYEYACAVEESHADVIYADEAILMDGKIIEYQIKPDYSTISLLKNFFIGQAALYKKDILSNVLKSNIISENPDTFCREIALKGSCITDKYYHLRSIVLLHQGYQRNKSGEDELLSHMNIYLEKRKENLLMPAEVFSYDVLQAPCKLNQIAFILIEQELQRTRQTLSQLVTQVPEARICLSVYEKDLQEFKDFSKELNAEYQISIKTIHSKYYAENLQCWAETTCAEIDIVVRDTIEWINRKDVIHMIKCFADKSVGAVSPRIATSSEKDEKPVILYAGGVIADCAVNSRIFDGRPEARFGEEDLAWTSREIPMLSHNIYALRSELWRKVWPLHSTIKSSFELATELSFILGKSKVKMEYCGNAAVWAFHKYIKIYDRHSIKEFLEFYDSNGGDETDPVCSFHHWYIDYADTIRTEYEKSVWMLQSYRTHLNEAPAYYPSLYKTVSTKKNILIVSHELSLTGAPIVLQELVLALKDDFNFMVIAPEDGPQREKYTENGISVLIDPQIMDNKDILLLARSFDMVLVNTVVPFRIIDLLGKTNIPTIWWIHDSEFGYVDWLQFELPERLGNNIQTYCVSEYAKKILVKYRPLYKADIFYYGLQDMALTSSEEKIDLDIPQDKISFLNIGQIMIRKGQDLLVKAIELLPEEIIKKACFIFVGKVIDQHIFNIICDLQERYPENIRYIPGIPHESIDQLYREVDVVICSSRDDPLPTFITEGMIFSKVCICSEKTGFYSIIENGLNGYKYKNNDIAELSGIIEKNVRYPEEMKRVSEQARNTYESFFSIDIASEKLKKILE